MNQEQLRWSFFVVTKTCWATVQLVLVSTGAVTLWSTNTAINTKVGATLLTEPPVPPPPSLPFSEADKHPLNPQKNFLSCNPPFQHLWAAGGDDT